MPDSWLKKAMRKARRLGTRRRHVQKWPPPPVSDEAATISSASRFDLGLRRAGFNELQNSQPGRPVAFPAPAASAGFPGCQSRTPCKAATEWPPRPASSARHRADSFQQRVGEKGDEDAENDVELKHAGQSPAILCRGYFGNVKRRRQVEMPMARPPMARAMIKA